MRAIVFIKITFCWNIIYFTHYVSLHYENSMIVKLSVYFIFIIPHTMDDFISQATCMFFWGVIKNIKPNAIILRQILLKLNIIEFEVHFC